MNPGAGMAAASSALGATTRGAQPNWLRRFGEWLAGPAGMSVAITLIVLKLMALADDKNWRFFPNDPGRTLAQVHPGQWADVMVILLEGLVAGAAVSIVYSFTINHVSQTITNIWQRLEPLTPDPRTLLVDEDTRGWVTGLTSGDLRAAQKELREQENRIQRLTNDVAAKAAEITSLKVANEDLAARLEAVDAWFERFEKLADETKKLRKDIKP